MFLVLALVFVIGIVVGAVLGLRSLIENEPAPRVSYGQHVGAWVREGYYQPLFAEIDSHPVAGKTAVAAIVNHHLFAPDLIAATLHAVANRQPSIVVLISPNHFGIGSAGIITSRYDWQTMEGVLQGAPDMAEQLSATGQVVIDEGVFAKEHGIFNEVAFVRHTFPSTRFLPLIVREDIPAQSMDRLADTLHTMLPSSALVVGSFDFSHYQKDAVAKAHDAQSLDVLERLDADHTAGMDIDARMGLRLLLRYARLRGAGAFHLTGHSSSAERMHDPETTENTSYLTGYFTTQ